MRIKITEDMKRVITLSEENAVKLVQNCMKEQKNLQWEAERALELASNNTIHEVLKVDAEIAKNSRVWDFYNEGTECIDILVTAYGFDYFEGFYSVSFYLSDIWQLGSENQEEIKAKMYIRKYTQKAN